MNRAYSTFQIKEFDEGEGILRGLASTPSPDRMGDIVEPSGAKFALPLPLLWQHNSAQPIGTVLSAKVTKAGIEVVAKVAKGVSAEIDNAWKLIKAGLVRGFSIGFRGLDSEQIKDSYGIRFKSWEWLELSAVTIPANAEATIHTIKAFDTFHPGAASGAVSVAPSRVTTPGATGSPTLPKGKAMTTETVRAMEAERAAKAARMGAILEKSQAESRTLTVEEQGQYDSIRDELKSIDGHLARLTEFEALTSGATQVPTNAGNGAVKTGSAARGGATITHQRKNDDIPGLAMARVLQCKGAAILAMRQGNFIAAHEIAEQMFRDDPRIAQTLKAAQVAGSTVSGNWAADLITTDGGPFADFVEYLRPMTILGKFGQGNVPALNRVPFRAPLGVQTGGGAGYWVGEGKGKGLTQFDYDQTRLLPLKVANIVVGTMELLRDASVSAGLQMRDQLVAALQARLDTDFVDPTKTASSGISPASITNGVSAPNSSGTDADAVRADLKTLLNTYLTANQNPTSAVLLMTPSTALSISLMTNGLGAPEFPGLSMTGGSLQGIPVITSQYVPTVSAGSYLIMVNARDIWLADEGGFSVDMSTEASLEMDSAPTQSSVTTVAATSVVSMFQTNSVAFRAERTINWAKARSGAVAMIDTVNYA